jgi:hypothetical protein
MRVPEFGIDPIPVSDLGDAIVGEAKDQWHFAPYNFDALKSSLDSAVQQLPTTLLNTVQKFVGDFESNYTALLNQRIVIGEILENKVAPTAEAQEMQIKDTFQ